MTDSPRVAASYIKVDTVLGDIDAAIDQHVASRIVKPDDARRAIDAALNSIYRASNALSSSPSYWSAANRSVDGRTMQAVVYVRGRMTHGLVETHETEILVPSSEAFPSADLYPQVNYFWVLWPEMADEMKPVGRHDKRDLVQQHLAGRLVVESLRRSSRYLRSVADKSDLDL